MSDGNSIKDSTPTKDLGPTKFCSAYDLDWPGRLRVVIAEPGRAARVLSVRSSRDILDRLGGDWNADPYFAAVDDWAGRRGARFVAFVGSGDQGTGERVCDLWAPVAPEDCDRGRMVLRTGGVITTGTIVVLKFVNGDVTTVSHSEAENLRLAFERRIVEGLPHEGGAVDACHRGQGSAPDCGRATRSTEAPHPASRQGSPCTGSSQVRKHALTCTYAHHSLGSGKWAHRQVSCFPGSLPSC